MDNENEAATSEQATRGGLMSKLVMGVVAILLLVVGVFAGPAVKNLFGASQPEEQSVVEPVDEHSDEPALYTSLHPPLVVNLKDTSGSSHYMQITMEVMARDQHVIDAVKNHAPAIRNSLILMYGSNVDYDAVNTREGKEKMLADALAAIQKIMRERIGTDGVEAVYFTSLIIQ